MSDGDPDRSGWGARVAIATGALLLAACLAGAPLYVSSVGSEAIQQQLAQTCASDSALSLLVPSHPAVERGEIEALAGDVPHVQAPVVGVNSFVVRHIDANLTTQMTLIFKEGADQQVTPALLPLGENELAISRTNLRILGRQVGDQLVGVDAGGRDVGLVIAQTFDDIPIQPEPSYWCGYRQLLRPGPDGDAAPVWAMASPTTQRRLSDRSFTSLESRPAARPLTMHEAEEMARGYDRVYAEYIDRYGSRRNVSLSSAMPTLLARANGVKAAVGKAVAPVRLTGVVAALMVMVAAGVMLARERRRELRLLAIRGVPPWRSTVMMLRAVGAPVALGAAA